MADALTKWQLELLRRVRDAGEVISAPRVLGLMSEVGLLTRIGLLNWDGNFRFSLTELGTRYLMVAEDELLANPPCSLDAHEDAGAPSHGGSIEPE
jgi:hypothetical protein